MLEKKTGSYGIVNRPENKELVAPTPLLIRPKQQGFCYAAFADRNPPPGAEIYDDYSFQVLFKVSVHN